MVLLHDIIQVFHLPNRDGGAVLLVVVLDGRFIGRTPVDRDRLGHAVTAERFGQEALRGLLIPLLGEEKGNGLTMFVYSTIEVIPRTFDLDVRLVHAPADPHRALPAVERLRELRTVLDDPPIDGGMIDMYTPFKHESLDRARTEGIGHVPADAHENDLLGEMGTFEAHRHGRSPSLFTLSHSGRAYLKSPQMKTCDRTSRVCCTYGMRLPEDEHVTCAPTDQCGLWKPAMEQVRIAVEPLRP